MSDIGERLIEAVRDVALGNPLFVYQQPFGGCVYVSGGQPSCIVGHAAWNLGLIDANFEGSGSNHDDVLGFLSSVTSERLDPEEESWLCSAQESQDTGNSWQDAIRIADAVFDEYLEENDFID